MDLLSIIGASARSALERENITTLNKLILRLHGIGPSAILKLKKELESNGCKFKE